MSNVLLTAKNSADRTEVLEARIDPTSNGLVVIGTEHNIVHAGKMFSLSGVVTPLAAGATAYFHGLTDSKTVHFRAASIQANGAPINISFYEGATVSANGTEIFGKNRKRSSVNTPTLRTFLGPTVTTPGTVIEQGFIPVTGGSKQSGLADLFGTEWVLDLNTTSYLIAITNNDTQPCTIGYNFLWYEA